MSKNIFITTLSTLPLKPKVNYYYTKENLFCDGIGQQENIAKVVLSREKIDQIIAIGSDKTYNKEQIESNPVNSVFTADLCKESENYDPAEASRFSLCFFKYRIAQFLSDKNAELSSVAEQLPESRKRFLRELTADFMQSQGLLNQENWFLDIMQSSSASNNLRYDTKLRGLIRSDIEDNFMTEEQYEYYIEPISSYAPMENLKTKLAEIRKEQRYKYADLAEINALIIEQFKYNGDTNFTEEARLSHQRNELEQAIFELELDQYIRKSDTYREIILQLRKMMDRLLDEIKALRTDRLNLEFSYIQYYLYSLMPEEHKLTADFRNRTTSLRFIPVNYEDVRISGSTSCIDNVIKALKGDSGADDVLNLYIDIQGGDRTFSYILLRKLQELSQMDRKHIGIAGIYSTAYEPRNFAHAVIDETKTYTINMGSNKIIKASDSIIENPPAKGTKKKDSYNVLLMALSVFPGYNRDLNKYLVKESIFEYNGVKHKYYYQLEPVPRMLSMQLAEEDDCLDHIIMLETDGTADIEKSVKTIVLPDETELQVSPDRYMRDNIDKYLNPDSTKDNHFESIRINENEPAKGIYDTVQYLRKLKKAHNNMCLYMDEHGGFRGIQLLMEAMISLLRNEVNIKKIYAMRFSGGVGVIDEATYFNIFDFVSGINEFTNYARIESLNSYYKGIAHDDNIKCLLSNINEIAAGIQLCDIPKFEKGLQNLSEYYNKKRTCKDLPEGDVAQENRHYLQLFEEHIYNEYGDILSTTSALNEIEWCYKKGFYQQVLTLIEGRMPAELHKTNVFSYDTRTDSIAEVRRRYYDKDVFIFNRSVPAEIRYLKGWTTENMEEKILSFISACDLDDLWGKAIAHNSDAKKFYGNTFFYVNEEKDNKTDTVINSSYRKKIIFDARLNKQHLYAFMLLHVALKNLRNVSNHASSDSPSISMERTETLISKYIEWARKLEAEANV